MTRRSFAGVATVICAVVGIGLGLASGEARAANTGLQATIGAMAMSDSKSQGGQGPAGSTLLTQLDVFWNFPWVGVGMFAQWDRQGAGETDLSYGPRMEIHYGPFFVDAGYGMVLSRGYSDRVISSEGGQSFYFGLGFRAMLGKDEDLGGLFIQVSYKFRTFSVRDADGVSLSEPILQQDNYPLFGVGYSF